MTSKHSKRLGLALTVATAALSAAEGTFADPTRYPQIAQQKLPQNVSPDFISVDDLVAEVKAGEKPLIVDVRSSEEFTEAHILGSVSAPITEFASHIERIPRDRPVVLY
jgi:3-mercaptopyruvate sulfurtransferase SseA